MGLSLTPAPGGRRQAFRVAVRMAGRDIRRHKGRSLLIILLIMLPVAGMTGAATLIQSMQETAAERVQHQLGATQARFRPMPMANGKMVQDPVEEQRIVTNDWDSDPDFTPSDPRDALPAGYDVLTEATLGLTVRQGAADVRVVGRAVDALAPGFHGKYTLLNGRAPAGDAEVLVSPGLLDRFGLVLGEELTTSAGAFRITGALRDAGYSDGNSIVYLKPGQGHVVVEGPPGPKNSAPTTPAADSTMYYLVGPEPVTWAQVLEANSVGVTVLSRSVALNPPPQDQHAPESQRASPVPPYRWPPTPAAPCWLPWPCWKWDCWQAPHSRWGRRDRSGSWRYWLPPVPRLPPSARWCWRPDSGWAASASLQARQRVWQLPPVW